MDISRLEILEPTILVEFDETVSVIPSNATSTEIQEFDETVDVITSNATSTEILNTTSTISALIPLEAMQGFVITYWIHVEDTSSAEQESNHYAIGVKPTFKLDAAIELDITTSKAEGSTIRPTAYVLNTASEPVFGTVSLLVDGQAVSTKSLLLEPGETPVTLEWNIPKKGKQMSYGIQAMVELYGISTTTETAKFSSFMKTQIIPLSEMKTIQALTDDGTVIAQPALLYASDHNHDDLRFRVTVDGTCIIGGSEECAIKHSTSGERGGIASVEQNGTILRVKSTGPDSTLERFSITAADTLPGDWTITLESKDTFVPQESALDDYTVMELIDLGLLFAYSIQEIIMESAVKKEVEASVELDQDETIDTIIETDIDLKIKYKSIGKIIIVKSAKILSLEDTN